MSSQIVTINLPTIHPYVNKTKCTTIKNTFNIPVDKLIELSEKLATIINNNQNIKFLIKEIHRNAPANDAGSTIQNIIHELVSLLDQCKDLFVLWTSLSAGLSYPIDRSLAAHYILNDDDLTVSRIVSNYPRDSISQEELNKYNDNAVYFAVYVLTETFKYLSMTPNYMFDCSLPIFALIFTISSYTQYMSPVSTVTDDYELTMQYYALDLALRSRYVDFWREHQNAEKYVQQNCIMFGLNNDSDKTVMNVLLESSPYKRMRKVVQMLNNGNLRNIRATGVQEQKDLVKLLNDLPSLYEETVNKCSITDVNDPNDKVVLVDDLYKELLQNERIGLMFHQVLHKLNENFEDFN